MNWVLASSIRLGPGIFSPKNLTVYAVLFLINLGLYQHAIKYSFFKHSDHLIYLMEMAGSKTENRICSLCDYSINKKFDKTDEILYRPLLFLFLEAQYRLWGYHYLPWNIASFCLHLLITFLLFELLKILLPIQSALLLTLIFSTHTVTSALATNVHLGGYMIAYALYLAGLIAILPSIIQKSALTPRRYLLHFATNTVAPFFYEPILFFHILSALLAAPIMKRASWARLLIYPPLVYLILYVFRLPYTEQLFFIPRGDNISQIFSTENLVLIPDYFMNILFEWLKHILHWESSRFLGFVLMVVFFVRLIFYIGSPKKSGHLPLLFAGHLLIYLLLCCLLRGNGYQEYHPCLFLILSICFFASTSYKKILFPKFLNGIFNAVFIFLIFFNIFLTHKKISAENPTQTRSYFHQIEEFIDAHSKDKSFSFKIENPNPEIDQTVNLTEGYVDQSNKQIEKSFSEMAYAPYYSKNNPKFILNWSNKSKFTPREGD